MQKYKNLFRDKRIPFYYNETQYLITTVAQLNFFKWAVTYKVLEYVDINFTNIYKDMQQKKELIDLEALTTNDSSVLLKTQSESPSSTSKIIYSSEKIEISFDA